MGKSLPTEMDSNASKKSRKKSKKADPTVVVSEDSTRVSKDTAITTVPATNPPVGPDGIDTETMFENKKALKRAIRAARHRTTAELNVSSESPKQGGKRKDMASDTDDDEDPIASADEPPKKKHKNKTEFADPRVNESLAPQSRKALEYAFTQMNKPSKWKFNKARQNWLIRNIWTPESLPDVYVPLVLKYLANVQGGSKKKLIETCQSYLKVEEETDPKDAPSTTPASDTTPPTAAPPLKSILKPTAGPLITPGPLIDTPSTLAPGSNGTPSAGAIVNEEPALSPTALADIRRTRAQELLDALNSSTES